MNHFHFPYEPFTAAHTLFFYADNATQGQRALGPVVIDRTSLTSTCTVIIRARLAARPAIPADHQLPADRAHRQRDINADSDGGGLKLHARGTTHTGRHNDTGDFHPHRQPCLRPPHATRAELCGGDPLFHTWNDGNGRDVLLID